jgi:hypothetical protein
VGAIILELGSEENILPKNTWQCMGECTLGYSPVQLKLANQYRVFPIGRRKGVTIHMDGVCTMEDFDASDSNTVLDNWQHRLHEFSTRRLARIDCVVRWVGKTIREPPNFHGLNDLEEFFKKYEDEMIENYRLLALDISLKATPTTV